MTTRTGHSDQIPTCGKCWKVVLLRLSPEFTYSEKMYKTYKKPYFLNSRDNKVIWKIYNFLGS